MQHTTPDLCRTVAVLAAPGLAHNAHACPRSPTVGHSSQLAFHPPVAQSPGISQILQNPSTWSMRYALKYCARWDSRRFHLTQQAADREQADTGGIDSISDWATQVASADMQGVLP
jgi:hypothetical protein